MSTPQTPVGVDLDARYGRRSSKGRVRRVVVVAGVLVVAALAWLVWAQPWSVQAFWKPAAYQVIDDQSIAVSWSVTLGEGATASCAITAENVVHAVVGWKVVDVAGGQVPTQQRSEVVRTTERADKGFVYRCWLT